MIKVKRNSECVIINIDWLEWSGYLVQEGLNLSPELSCPDTYRLEILDGNNVYKWRAILYNCYGYKVFTMLWSPKSRLIQSNLVSFQIANYWLYEAFDIMDYIKLTWDVVDYQFATFTRIDICADFECKKRQKSIINAIWRQKAYVSGKKKGSVFWSDTSEGRFPHDFNFGSMQSAIKWKLYNKSLELKVGSDNPDKPYIIECWKNENMNIQNIWRLEVSIKDFNSIMTDDKCIDVEGDQLIFSKRRFDFRDLENQKIYDTFCSLYNKRFAVRLYGHTRVQNDVRLYLFRLDELCTVSSVKKTSGRKIADNSVFYYILKVVESDVAKVNEDYLKSVCDSLYYCVKFNHLENLFEKIKGMSVEEFIEKKYNSFGFGIVPYNLK